MSNNYFVKILACAVFVSLSYFSICGSHDLFAMYSAKQAALDRLVIVDKVSKNNIDGGLEFNGWPEDWEVHSRTSSSSWWNVKDDEFVVTLGPLANYKERYQYDFSRWLFMDKASVYVLQKIR